MVLDWFVQKYLLISFLDDNMTQQLYQYLNKPNEIPNRRQIHKTIACKTDVTRKFIKSSFWNRWLDVYCSAVVLRNTRIHFESSLNFVNAPFKGYQQNFIFKIPRLFPNFLFFLTNKFLIYLIFYIFN